MSRIKSKPTIPVIINRGTGAGGSKTNHNGLAFEDLTNPEKILIEKGFIRKDISKNKNGYYLLKDILDIPDEHKETKDEEYKTSISSNVIYMRQTGFREYIKKTFGIDVYRNPDEAYLIKKNDKYHLKIIEKKNQNVNGSVEDKLKTGVFNRDEYYMMFESLKDKMEKDNLELVIDYAFCVSEFLQKKFESTEQKYINMKKINDKNNIKVFYGNNPDYFDQLYQWIIQ